MLVEIDFAMDWLFKGLWFRKCLKCLLRAWSLLIFFTWIPVVLRYVATICKKWPVQGYRCTRFWHHSFLRVAESADHVIDDALRQDSCLMLTVDRGCCWWFLRASGWLSLPKRGGCCILLLLRWLLISSNIVIRIVLNEKNTACSLSILTQSVDQCCMVVWSVFIRGIFSRPVLLIVPLIIDGVIVIAGGEGPLAPNWTAKWGWCSWFEFEWRLIAAFIVSRKVAITI